MARGNNFKKICKGGEEELQNTRNGAIELLIENYWYLT
jgi:hypothetical protein